MTFFKHFFAKYFGMSTAGRTCPSCGSDDVIPWDKGYQCRDCGYEFSGRK